MIKITLTALVAALMLSSCGITRTEEDIYTRTHRDTTETHFVKNAPGNRDGGVVYPSSRTIEKERFTTLSDTSFIRKYPNFIRLGLFEAAGIFGGDGNYGIGSGIFGIYPDFSKLGESYRGSSEGVVPGGIYRVGILEKRLRWFNDAKNWTWGLYGFEAIFPDARLEKALIGIAPFYIRKRFFLREEIPYIAFTPTVGIGIIPSQYMNAGATFDIGSYGGLNIRAYAGAVLGLNSELSPQNDAGNNDWAISEWESVVSPYIGLGVSVLDFLNTVPETYVEWKDQKHSSWEIGLLRIGIISSTEESALPADTNRKIFNGYLLSAANASVVIPMFNNRFWAGTSLFNMVIMEREKTGIGILPLRLGYWLTAIEDDLTVEPYIEYNYYPSQFFQLAVKSSLRIIKQVNFSINMGYVTGENKENFLNFYQAKPAQFSGFYLGFSVGLLDRIFDESELRYTK